VASPLASYLQASWRRRLHLHRRRRRRGIAACIAIVVVVVVVVNINNVIVLMFNVVQVVMAMATTTAVVVAIINLISLVVAANLAKESATMNTCNMLLCECADAPCAIPLAATTNDAGSVSRCRQQHMIRSVLADAAKGNVRFGFASKRRRTCRCAFRFI